MATITVPASADIGAVADEVADNIAAHTGERDAQIAGALRTLATQALADVTALEAGTSIAGATALANGTVRLAGDLAGTGGTAAAPRTSGLNSATVPAGGALTTGNVLQVSGVAALSYAPVNLAGGLNYVTGVLPWANVAKHVGNMHTVRGVASGNVANLAAFTVAGHFGLTFAEGERVALPSQTTGAEDGIYVVGVVGGGTAPLTRASDWPLAAVLPEGQVIQVQEGTQAGEWKATVAGAITVGTTSPALYPKIQQGTSAALGGGTGSITISNVWLKATTNSIQATHNTHAGSPGWLQVPVASRTAGVPGTGQFVIDSSDNADTSTVDWLVTNY